jgi:hypothetical protein
MSERLSRVAVAACVSIMSALAGAGTAAASPAWLSPARLASSTVLTPECVARSAIGTGGDAVAAWSHQEEANYSVQASTRAAGGSWQAPATFPTIGDPCLQSIATDARGDAAAVWEGFDSSKAHVLQAIYRPAGGAWQGPVTITSEANSETLGADVAMDPYGNALVVWRSDTPAKQIESSFKPAGAEWQEAQPVSSEGQDQPLPQIAMDSSGNAIAIWEHSTGANERVQAAFRSAGGGWGPTANVTEPAPEVFRSSPRIAMNATGQAVAVWGRSDGTSSIVQASTVTGGGSWQPPVSLSEPGQSSEAPAVAIDASGDAVAAWERPFEGKHVIQAASRPAAGPWGPVSRLSESGQNAYWPHVAAGPRGEAIATWERYNGSVDLVQAAVSIAGGAWLPTINLSSESESSLAGAVSTDAQGNALAVWESHEGTTWSVQAAGYDAAGPLPNSLSIPSSGVAGRPVAFSVSPLDVWSALGATGWSFGDGSAATGSSVSHTFAAEGRYPVTVTTADAVGNTTTASATIVISPPRPILTSLRQSTSRWREGTRPARISRRPARPPIGTTISFALNVPAQVTARFTQTAAGRLVGRSCVAPSRRNARRRHCSRTLARGTLSLPGHAGVNRVIFQGKVTRSRRLAPGRYTLTVMAANSAGSSTPSSLAFTILR